ncbi:hypothetical protein [Pseudomonas oryzihabitans]|uniref:hypothetical protein n=1 Tax=Pseudomonas oryzihabitans TaxID=47885 RepID=UPI00289CD8EB|nr:hypothetical protein [Pseudomonas oryzihabitans]
MTKTAWVEQWLDEAAEDLLAGYPVKIDGATVVEPLDFYMALLLAYDAKRKADNHFQADREALLLGAVLNSRGDPADGHLFAVMGGRREVLAIAAGLCEPHADKAHTQYLASEEDERGWIEYQRRKDAA